MVSSRGGSPPPMGCRAAHVAPAVAGADPGRLGKAPGRGRSLDRLAQSVRDVCGHRGHRRDLSRAGQAAHRRRGMGVHTYRSTTICHLGDECRRRRLCGQRPQDGSRIRTGFGLPYAGRSHRLRPPVDVRRPADDDEPERARLQRHRRVAPADGRARRETPGRRAGIERATARTTFADSRAAGPRGRATRPRSLTRSGPPPDPRRRQ